MSFLPEITWPTLLATAPDFQTAIGHGVNPDKMPDVVPLHRAAYYYDLFDGEVSNGGVMQYFFNQAFSAPSFAQAPDFVAENPVLAPALPFLREVHATFDAVAPEVAAVHERDDWPEELFARHRGRFADLERAFFAINRDLAQRLAADIVARPHDYFTMIPLSGIPERGVAHVAAAGWRLRFENGFPVGPNILEREDGDYDVVWFSRDRTLMTAETGYGVARARTWIHYPSQRGGEWVACEDGRTSAKQTLALTSDHGLGEHFRPDGSLEHATFSLRGGRVWDECGYHADGTPALHNAYHGENGADGQTTWTTWPNGAPNAECVSEPANGWRQRFVRCLDADGRDLAPGGTGRLYQCLGEADGRRRWREGQLVAGYMEGEVVWRESALDGSGARETGRATYRAGEEVRGNS